MGGLAGACVLLGTAMIAVTVIRSTRRTIARRYRRPRRILYGLAGSGLVLVAVAISAMLLGYPDDLVRLMWFGAFASLALAGLAIQRLRIDPEPETPLHRLSILAVGAHPDDIELACGGALARFADLGHQVHVVVMSDGRQGGDRRSRAEEAKEAAGLMHATTVRVHHFPDTRLASVEERLRSTIESAIVRVGADILLTHSRNDQHQDHLAVHLAALRAARNLPTILCFESPSATREFDPSVFIDIEAYIDVKVQAVAAHRDQAGKPYMTAGRVRGVARFRGAQAKRVYAEGFEPVRLLASEVGRL